MSNIVENMLHINIITPEKTIFSEEAEMVVIPGIEGEFGVLAGHIPFISIIKPGIINIYKDGIIVKKVFVAGGFAEINSHNCIVLAEQAVDIKNIQKHELEERIAEIYSTLEDVTEVENTNYLHDELSALNYLKQNI
ncbi:MAG: ATP synthase F1 subunit epsilon [Alphaproteobacteria bacterium]